MDISRIPEEIRATLSPDFLDILAQDTGRPVFGEKDIEPHLPALSRQAAAEGAVLLKNDNGISALLESPRQAGGGVRPGTAGLFLCGLRLRRGREPALQSEPDGGPEKRRRPGGRGAGPGLRPVEQGERALYGLLGPLAPVL